MFDTMPTKEQQHVVLQTNPERNTGWLRGMRTNRRGAVGNFEGESDSSTETAQQANQNVVTVRNVQMVVQPTLWNNIKAGIYTPIGADLLILGTKSYFVRGVVYVLDSIAPYYFQGVKESVAGIPHVDELFRLAGLVLLVDGAVRICYGAVNYYTNRKISNRN